LVVGGDSLRGQGGCELVQSVEDTV
jgi:hypothetical protein